MAEDSPPWQSDPDYPGEYLGFHQITKADVNRGAQLLGDGVDSNVLAGDLQLGLIEWYLTSLGARRRTRQQQIDGVRNAAEAFRKHQGAYARVLGAEKTVTILAKLDRAAATKPPPTAKAALCPDVNLSEAEQFVFYIAWPIFKKHSPKHKHRNMPPESDPFARFVQWFGNLAGLAKMARSTTAARNVIVALRKKARSPSNRP